MADTDVKPPETVVQEPLKNDVTPVAEPPKVTSNEDSSEQLKKELEQARMRERQLQNQLEAKTKAEDEAKRKQLEEQDEWKQVAEQEKAKREALENEREEAETKERLNFATDTIYAEFSQEVIDVAKEAGLSLSEDSDEAKNTLKTKLERISQKVVSPVTPNNPGQSAEPNNRAELIEKMRMGDKEAKFKAINTLKSLDTMRAQAGYVQEQ